MQISPGFCLLAAWFGTVNGYRLLVTVLAAALIHEAGHWLALRAVGAEVLGLRVGMLGMVMETDSRIIITISDDGAGMNEDTLLHLQVKLRGDEPVSFKRTRGNGIALPNVSRRIKLLFGEDCGVYVMSTLGLGTDVEITLPHRRGAGDGL